MKKNRSITLSQVIEALKDLGGQATRNQIHEKVTEIRNGDYSHYKNWSNYITTMNQVIQRHCLKPESYVKYKGPAFFQDDGNGVIRLLDEPLQSIRNSTPSPVALSTAIAVDFNEPSATERVEQTKYRILRDTALAQDVKRSNGYQCQICGQVFMLDDNTPYAEAHHIMPLGAPHNGPDVRGNILCVCPNDHARLDYGAIRLNHAKLKGITKKFVEYHNNNVFVRVE